MKFNKEQYLKNIQTLIKSSHWRHFFFVFFVLYIIVHTINFILNWSSFYLCSLIFRSHCSIQWRLSINFMLLKTYPVLFYFEYISITANRNISFQSICIKIRGSQKIISCSFGPFPSAEWPSPKMTLLTLFGRMVCLSFIENQHWNQFKIASKFPNFIRKCILFNVIFHILCI